MMAGIQGKDTKPEIAVRKGLFARGFRYRIHVKTLPGKPDLVFPKYKAVIFIHGCFWHGHDCHLFRWPSTHSEFWAGKIETNKKRDEQAVEALEKAGWKVLVIWECALKGKHRKPLETVLDNAGSWIMKNPASSSIEGIRNH
jgi:DNA mismatch endonuclease (patch repair protein)